jgi:hypothetical protein
MSLREGEASAEAVEHLRPGDPLDDAGRAWLKRRIQSLRSRAGSSGPMRASGIHRTIEGMKDQLSEGAWRPHGTVRSEEDD